ncbi:hypothetical protein SAMN05660484_00273 [Eubacterium ruminantium]|uniref:Uncharacterized protein n=1 Tax=Eubacterium ruminantium TaxID=42322 RepID=A0A1T4K0H0_9FIRM|nr:hypothetical protein [Eubacterium ruminantium]SCW28730.1 hypothetical protein SAMN05660484_00273 [Eubacterium ruminantium]SDM10802.1 hypothetical protein SAMN04490370_10169 [Eubacterium ruminantium]SJZ35874.1 hypothetical protein SAMN02745110_00069 [Eubacterium ruminantium]
MERENSFQKNAKIVMYMLGVFFLVSQLMIIFSDNVYKSGALKFFEFLSHLSGILCVAFIGYLFFTNHEEKEVYSTYAIGIYSLMSAINCISLLILYIGRIKNTGGRFAGVLALTVGVVLALIFMGVSFVWYGMDRITCVIPLLVSCIAPVFRYIVLMRIDKNMLKYTPNIVKESAMTVAVFIEMLFAVLFFVSVVIIQDYRFIVELKENPKKIFTKDCLVGTYKNLYEEVEKNYVSYENGNGLRDVSQKIEVDEKIIKDSNEEADIDSSSDEEVESLVNLVAAAVRDEKNGRPINRKVAEEKPKYSLKGDDSVSKLLKESIDEVRGPVKDEEPADISIDDLLSSERMSFSDRLFSDDAPLSQINGENKSDASAKDEAEKTSIEENNIEENNIEEKETDNTNVNFVMVEPVASETQVETVVTDNSAESISSSDLVEDLSDLLDAEDSISDSTSGEDQVSYNADDAWAKIMEEAQKLYEEKYKMADSDTSDASIDEMAENIVKEVLGESLSESAEVTDNSEVIVDEVEKTAESEVIVDKTEETEETTSVDNRFYDMEARVFNLSFDKFAIDYVYSREEDNRQFDRIVDIVKFMSDEDKIKIAHKLNGFIYYNYNQILKDKFDKTGSLIDYTIMISCLESFKPDEIPVNKIPVGVQKKIIMCYDGFFPDDYMKITFDGLRQRKRDFYQEVEKLYTQAGNVLLIPNSLGNQFLSANFVVMLLMASLGGKYDKALKMIKNLRNECLNYLSTDDIQDDMFVLKLSNF